MEIFDRPWSSKMVLVKYGRCGEFPDPFLWCAASSNFASGRLKTLRNFQKATRGRFETQPKRILYEFPKITEAASGVEFSEIPSVFFGETAFQRIT